MVPREGSFRSTGHVRRGAIWPFHRQLYGLRLRVMPPEPVVIDRGGVDALIAALRSRGYRTIGPVVRNGAIVHAEISSVADLPAGWHDEQAPGSYRIHHNEDDDELFGWAVGPQSFKASLFPPASIVWRGRRDSGGVLVEQATDEAPPEAFFGARPCEVAGMSVLGTVLSGGAYPDPNCARHQSSGFVVAVECGAPASTCFCSSMGSGPSATEGFDIALTELTSAGDHRFLARAGTEKGQSVLDEIPQRELKEKDREDRHGVIERSREIITRHLDASAVPSLLARNLEHPRWEDVAERCLACGNCTLVCPTCFCAATSERTNLSGEIQLERRWDSCFDLAHSYLHGGSVRVSTRSRYRQWMTHKLSTWVDQFGMSGCVGCGRCITWCPVGIDITEEVSAIAETDGATMTNEVPLQPSEA